MTRPQILTSPSVALFFDFDGTIVEIAERPDAVEISKNTWLALKSLFHATDGAVAIVTGREIAFIDEMLSPLQVPVAGVHGLMRRDATGCVTRIPENADFMGDAEDQVAALVEKEPGLLLERKGVSLALHYRNRPELADECFKLLNGIVAQHADMELKRGKMVLEAKPAGTDKGTAVAAFMDEDPFRGRLPVFAGDDVTDEDAFERVNKMGGLTIKVGEGATVAQTRFDDTQQFLEWLGDSARQLSGEIKT